MPRHLGALCTGGPLEGPPEARHPHRRGAAFWARNTAGPPRPLSPRLGWLPFVCLDEMSTYISGLWVERSPSVMCGTSRNQWEGFPSRPPWARHCASALLALPQAHLPAGLGLAASTIPRANSDNVSSLHTVFLGSPPAPAPEDTVLKRAKVPGSQDSCV